MEQNSNNAQGCTAASVFTLYSLSTCFLSFHSIPASCGKHHGEADPAQDLPIELPKLGLFITVLCVPKVHLPPLLLDALKGGNGFLFCSDTAVAARNQSSIGRLNQACHLIYADK